MPRKPPLGLFITGNDTDAGKTYVAALIARELKRAGLRVGVYKPVASDCRRKGNRLVSADAEKLWKAAGSPGELERVCPQGFRAPLAPHLAAVQEGKRVDPKLLRSGLKYWRDCSDFVIVEGSGGLMSPVTDDEYVADLAYDFKYPLLVVARNQIGVINQVLQTLISAAAFQTGLPVAGVILNRVTAGTDPSLASNRAELSARSFVPVLAELGYGAKKFEEPIDWLSLTK